ncbi:MAG: glycoside hydrolase family 97 protein [Tannerella sp.]|jgi:hypothetical protein|nr:glycoside hydrolase family 97 protein [Tannerella sp.]
MNQLKLTLLILPVFFLFSPCLAKTGKLISPNGKINISVEVENTGNDGYGQVCFTVKYDKNGTSKTVFSQVNLGLKTELQDLGSALKLVSVSKDKDIEDDYTMISGKRSHCTNKAVERTYRFENRQGQSIDIGFRAYNDGVAFNYSIQSVNNEKEFITEELTSYPIPEGTNRWMQQYAIDYEGFFPLQINGEAKGRNAHLWGYPALIEPDSSFFVLITEANIQHGHSGSRLYNGNNLNLYQVRMIDEKVAFQGSWASPWRLLIIGSLADIVESTLVTDVSEPNKIADTDWIVPGQAAWVYWANNHGSKDYQVVKEYIDLAAEMGWRYNLIDWEWDVMSNGGTVMDAIQYAREKNVKTLLWYNSGTSWIGPGAPGPLDRLNKKEDREAEYAKLNQMGVSGIKIDFFAQDGASMMDYYMDLLEDAAKYKLLITFHGAAIPRGWQRTYPNLMTTEAVYGAEWYNNRPVLTNRAAAHNATLPFTRNVIGSMDYTPGTFSDSQHPHITSHGHELALYVLFESALQHMPDRPSSYRSLPEPVKQFLADLPTAWDDTKFLGGYPAKEVIIARRKGDVWFIGGINGTDELRTLRFSLESLAPTGKTITIFKDGNDNRSFDIKKELPLSDKTMNIDCLPRGGFVAVIK